MKYKRIVFKVGTSSLTNEDGSLSRSKVKAITQQLAVLHEAGHELILVSSGAVAAGFGALGFKKRPTKIADKQASAAVGQGLLLEEYTTNLLMRQIVSAQILLTQDDFVDKRRYKNAHQALSVLLSRGAIPIINENDSVVIDELKVGDNDTLSAQVAAMVQADLLVLLTDVDGLYTGNPNSDPTAKRLEKIETINREIIDMAGGAGSSNGTGGMLTKIKAATIATESGVPVYICSSLKSAALIEAVGWFLLCCAREGTSYSETMAGLLCSKSGNDLGRWWSCRGTFKKREKSPFIRRGRSGRKLLLPRYCNSG